jgi:hypothetical protein
MDFASGAGARGPGAAGGDEEIRAVLRDSRTWAVVGCSPDPRRDSHRIAALLQRTGYRIVPVNPTVEGSILGEQVHPSLDAVPEDVEIDVVDIFRRSELAGAHVEEAIRRGARAVWMQLGVIDHDAARMARKAGLSVIMDRCPAIELPRMR